MAPPNPHGLATFLHSSTTFDNNPRDFHDALNFLYRRVAGSFYKNANMNLRTWLQISRQVVVVQPLPVG